jgi:hypothetical protein
MNRENLLRLKKDLERDAREFETWRSGLVDLMHEEYGITPHASCASSFMAITLCINRAKMELLEAAAKVERILESDG